MTIGFSYSRSVSSVTFYVAKEKDGTALRRLVITEEEKRGSSKGATLLLFLDSPAAIILLRKSKSGFTGLTTTRSTRTRWKWLVTNFIYLPMLPHHVLIVVFRMPRLIIGNIR